MLPVEVSKSPVSCGPGGHSLSQTHALNPPNSEAHVRGSEMGRSLSTSWYASETPAAAISACVITDGSGRGDAPEPAPQAAEARAATRVKAVNMDLLMLGSPDEVTPFGF